jgi:lysophospholipase L1-like esterase
MDGTAETQLQKPVKTVICLGESLTKGEVSYNWVGSLQSRPQNTGIQFINLGVGGDHSYNALQRLPKVIQYHPDKVVILIGAGDIISTLSATREWVFRTWKRIPQKHSLKWCDENIQQIIKKLKTETTAKIALCSLPLAGEDPDSEINKRVKESSIFIKQIADEENLYYVPFYESMYERVVASPGRDFNSNFLFDFLSQCRAAFQILVLHKNNLDEIGQKAGWRFHTDGLHLNSQGGRLLEDLVQKFIED